jgi:lipopolysaccharide/colanic/teichoic acid biosynthesis glycosyltransferase
MALNGWKNSMLRKGRELGTHMGKTPDDVLIIENQALRRSREGYRALRLGQVVVRREGVIREDSFQSLLTLERRRAERSNKQFVLMLLDGRFLPVNGNIETFLGGTIAVLSRSIRETDLVGWYKEGQILAVLFTEINCEGEAPITDVLHSKVLAALQRELNPDLLTHLRTSIHLFPENKGEDNSDPLADISLYPELSEKERRKPLPQLLKRAIDILGSASLLLLLAPVYGLIAMAIKLTSKGPVVFKQARLGQFGSRFKCLKFRTMYVNNDPEIHRDYIAKFIAGKAEGDAKAEGKTAVFKITKDPRVTPVGKFLRKTSLDELPQFWNVLRGEMSLVGPRPPVPYEFKIYDVWHRRRVIEVKPGVTGLWQVSGRSRTSFDDMVRLDLRYTQSWSLWLDLKILMATPRAVLSGEGAY